MRASIEANILHATPGSNHENGLDIRPEEFEEFDFIIAGFHFGCFDCSSIRNWLWSHGIKFGEEKLKESNTKMVIDALGRTTSPFWHIRGQGTLRYSGDRQSVRRDGYAHGDQRQARSSDGGGNQARHEGGKDSISLSAATPTRRTRWEHTRQRCSGHWMPVWTFPASSTSGVYIRSAH